MNAQEVRKNYFKDYKLKADEYLTAKYELICKNCGDKRYYQWEKDNRKI